MYTHYAVGVPSKTLSQQEFQRLLDIIAYNTVQLKKALGADSLAVVHLWNRLWFPWFTPRGICGETEDYHRLINGLCEIARAPYRPSKASSRRAVRFLLHRSGF